MQTKDVVEPDPAWARVYGEQQHRYRALYPALRDLERRYSRAVKAVLIERPHEVAYVELDDPTAGVGRGRSSGVTWPASAAPTSRCSTGA